MKRTDRSALIAVAMLAAVGLLSLVGTRLVEAAFPGANGEIAFVSDRDGDGDIYTINQSGTGLRRLTNDPKEDRRPAWSPDGSKIAFVRSELSNDTVFDHEIWVMNADGSAQRRLTAPDVGIDPAWSPDGSKIAFEGSQRASDGTTNGSAIWVMNADGTGQRRVSNLGGGSQTVSPAWSPDGRKITFSSERYDIGADPDQENYEVYTMNADGSGRTRLTNSPAMDLVGKLVAQRGQNHLYELRLYEQELGGLPHGRQWRQNSGQPHPQSGVRWGIRLAAAGAPDPYS